MIGLYGIFVGSILAVGISPALYQPQIIPIEQITRIRAQITAYSAIETCKTICTTASGKKPEIGDLACPPEYPFKTQVLIEEKIYTCEDRTADWIQKRGLTFDIFMGYTQKDYIKALNYGRRNLSVAILQKGQISERFLPILWRSGQKSLE